jgi:hypothetical protein
MVETYRCPLTIHTRFESGAKAIGIPKSDLAAEERFCHVQESRNELLYPMSRPRYSPWLEYT